jgi:SAM-dependent methyltransferase
MTENRDPCRSPWLSIPAEEYEGHMASPGVRQLQHLSRVFGGLLDEFSPESVAVLGVSGGNGLEHIDPGRVKRVVGVDINPAYLDLARSRHGARLPGLELVCGDIASCELPPASFDLVYAALVFEYLEPAAAVGRIADWLKPGGVAAALLQLPSPAHGRVSETPYRSVRMLEPHIHLVEPAHLRNLFAGRGFREIRCGTETLEGGKGFFLEIYRR